MVPSILIHSTTEVVVDECWINLSLLTYEILHIFDILSPKPIFSLLTSILKLPVYYNHKPTLYFKIVTGSSNSISQSNIGTLELILVCSVFKYLSIRSISWNYQAKSKFSLGKSIKKAWSINTLLLLRHFRVWKKKNR